MNLELICWIAAFFIVWEVLYILRLKYFEEDFLGYKHTWIWQKFISGFITFSFFLFQFIILANYDKFGKPWSFNYIRLLYEAIVIIILTVFLLLNKKISEIVKPVTTKE